MTVAPETPLLEELVAMGLQSDAEIDIGRAALLLARLDLPEVECEPYYAHLEPLRTSPLVLSSSYLVPKVQFSESKCLIL